LDIALRLDLDDLTGMASSGLHLATLGGVWHALLFGFAGVRVVDDALLIDPRLPLRWSTLHLRFRCLGRRIDLRIGHDSTHVAVSGSLRVRTRCGSDIEVTRHVHLVQSDVGWVVSP
jgi:trehalose/maltose hydrolase-like predicted phosphorylase